MRLKEEGERGNESDNFKIKYIKNKIKSNSKEFKGDGGGTCTSV